MVSVPDRSVAVISLSSTLLSAVSSATASVPGIFSLSSALAFNFPCDLYNVRRSRPGLYDLSLQGSITQDVVLVRQDAGEFVDVGGLSVPADLGPALNDFTKLAACLPEPLVRFAPVFFTP